MSHAGTDAPERSEPQAGSALAPSSCSLFFDDGEVTIYNGDCREIIPQLAMVDLVLTDPPYGADWEYDDHEDDFAGWKALMDEVIPMCRAKAMAVALCTSKIEGERHIWMHHAPDWRLCWYKGACPTRSHVGFKDWEPVFVWGRTWKTPMHDHFHAGTLPFGTHGHPCPKNEAWANWLLSRMLPDGGTVLDPFMGSRTTLRCAKDRGIRAIGIDVSEEYCGIARARMAQSVLNFGENR
jgi:hypothetical protein